MVAEFVDEATSARSEDRPSFQRMIAESKHKPRPWDIIIVRKFSRFARDVMASRVYKSMLAKIGIKVVSAHEDVGDDASGQLFEGLIELMDEFYSLNIANETKSGMETNTKRGFRNGGTAPYGYRNERHRDEATGKERTRLVEDPIEAPVVRRIFRQYVEGAGLGQIAAELDGAGIRPRKAATWLKTSIHNILHLETYRGVLLWRKTGKDSSGWVRQVGGCPALIDEATWSRVQARIQEKQSAGVGRKSDGSGWPWPAS